MYYTYVLQSEVDNQFYVGYTKDLKLRFEKHNNGYIESTQKRRPLKLIYYEACLTRHLREKLSSLSEFIREIKVGFSRYYNGRYNRRGYFWATDLRV